MTQDSDVARMAAALRTPSLRYRSFGNNPVRNPARREQVAAPDEFPLLDEALAAIDELPPDAPPMRPAPAPAPVAMAEAVPPSPAMPTTVAVPPRPPAMTAPPPGFVPSPAPVASPVVPAPILASWSRPVVDAPVAPSPGAVPVAAPPGPGTPVPGAGRTPSLLQMLLAEAPSRPTRPSGAPIVVGRHPPQAPVPPPRSAAVEPAPPAAPPTTSARAAAPMPSPDSRETVEGSDGRQVGAGTGSSLLDTLVGPGDAAQSAAHYPLLDALTAAMRSDLSGASSRVWPAARVEMALPELLRRIAAGVRSGRSLV